MLHCFEDEPKLTGFTFTADASLSGVLLNTRIKFNMDVIHILVSGNNDVLYLQICTAN